MRDEQVVEAVLRMGSYSDGFKVCYVCCSDV